jgi:hypothetical protein
MGQSFPSDKDLTGRHTGGLPVIHCRDGDRFPSALYLYQKKNAPAKG